jgi:hypothetical protein
MDQAAKRGSGIMMSWQVQYFNEQQLRLIRNCRRYASAEPAGMPGHNLALIIDRLADLLDSCELSTGPLNLDSSRGGRDG